MKAPDEAGTSKTVVLVAVTISSFLAPMALSSVNVALPTMAKELAMDALSLSWVATAYMAAAAMFPAPLSASYEERASCVSYFRLHVCGGHIRVFCERKRAVEQEVVSDPLT
jgi:MFS family permease